MVSRIHRVISTKTGHGLILTSKIGNGLCRHKITLIIKNNEKKQVVHIQTDREKKIQFHSSSSTFFFF